MKNILITGASGLIGSELIESISSLDYSINALYRNNISLQHKNVKWIKADLYNINIEKLSPYFNDLDILIHNAASKLTGSTKEEEDYLQKVNIDATLKLFELAGKFGVNKVIFTSGFNILQKPLPPIIYESSNTEPLTFYAKSKLIGEEYLKKYATKYGFQYNILRISSPVNFNLKLMPDTIIRKWIEKSLKGETILIYGKGRRTQDFVSVKDITKAFVACIHNIDIAGTFNIASGNQLSMLQLAKIITDKFKNKYEFSGTDINENDKWNISIEKACRHLKYKPEYTSEASVKELLENT